METAQLARVVVLMWGLMKNAGVVSAGDPGVTAILEEIEAYIETLRAKTRAQEAAPYHLTKRGSAALERSADRADD